MSDVWQIAGAIASCLTMGASAAWLFFRYRLRVLEETTRVEMGELTTEVDRLRKTAAPPPGSARSDSRAEALTALRCVVDFLDSSGTDNHMKLAQSVHLIACYLEYEEHYRRARDGSVEQRCQALRKLVGDGLPYWAEGIEEVGHNIDYPELVKEVHKYVKGLAGDTSEVPNVRALAVAVARSLKGSLDRLASAQEPSKARR